MALTNTNVPSAASDVVGVFNQNFQQVFPLARPIKCMVDETAKAMEHPTETGVVITDHIIFQPNEIELATILPAGEYRSVYQQIHQIYKASTILTVQTRASTYKNMFIYRMPHQEDPELFDTISLSIKLREVLIFSTTTQALPPTAVKNPVNQSTVNKGLQQQGPPRSLPAPAVFNPNPPALPGAAVGPFPNDQSYFDYESSDLPVEPLTETQIEQILEAK